MCRKKFCAALFTAALMMSSVTFAADSVTMSLDKAIDLALANNHTITQYAEDRESARWNLSAVRRNAGPRITWSSTANYIGGKGVRESQDYYAQYHFYYNDDDWQNANRTILREQPPYHTEVYHSFSLTFPLYTGGRLENQIESAEYGLNSADMTLEYAQQNIKYQAAEAYYQVLQCNDAIKVQEEAVNFLQTHLDTVQIQYEVGTTAKADVLSTAVQLANYKRQLNSAWGNYETAVARLNNIIGLPVDTVLVTDEDLGDEPYSMTEEECINYALEHRPDGRSAAYAVKQAQATVGATKAGYRPSITAAASASMSGEKYFESNHNAENWQVGLRMEWNVFDNGITAAQVSQAKSAERKAESQMLQQLDTIKLDVHNAYISLLTAEKNIDVAADAVSEAEDAYEIAKVRYIEGVDTNLNVMDAQEKVAEARNNYYNALYAYNVSKAKLDQVIGVPVRIDALKYVTAVDEGKTSPQALKASSVESSNRDSQAQ